MGKKFTNNVSFVQKVVIFHPTEDKFLILTRNSTDKSRPGDIDIPGGSVQYNENHEEALKREVQEETSLKIKDIKPIFIKTEPYNDDYFLFIGYKARSTSDKIVLNKAEHSDYEWISKKDFKSNYPNHILFEIITEIS